MPPLKTAAYMSSPNRIRSGVYRHYTGGQGGYLEIAREDLPTPEPIACPMRAGSVLFMTNLTPHASFENNTDIVRWGVDSPATKTPRFRTTLTKTPKTSARNATRSPWPAGLERATLSSKTRKTQSAKVTDIAKFKEIRTRYEQTPVHKPGRGWTPFAERKRKKGTVSLSFPRKRE